MSKRALLMHEGDDVVTVIEAVAAGETVKVATKAAAHGCELVSLEDVPRFHKICLSPLAPHDLVRKYGEVIGEATAPIERGAYVHTHNIASLKTGVRA